MSSGCGDVLTLEDLKTAKKHQVFEAEVITGKAGGLPEGADIDFATNQVTGQVQKTMPAILRDVGFRPAAFTFDTGGTLNVGDSDMVVLWPKPAGDGQYYLWKGAYPKTIPASSTPASTGGVSDSAWLPWGDITLRDELNAPFGYSVIGEFTTIAALRAFTGTASMATGSRVSVQSYYTGGNTGGGFFRWNATSTDADDGGYTINPTGNSGPGRWKREFVAAYATRTVSPVDFGAKINDSTFDSAPAINAAISYLNPYTNASMDNAQGGDVVLPAGQFYINDTIYGAPNVRLLGTGGTAGFRFSRAGCAILIAMSTMDNLKVMFDTAPWLTDGSARYKNTNEMVYGRTESIGYYGTYLENIVFLGRADTQCGVRLWRTPCSALKGVAVYDCKTSFWINGSWDVVMEDCFSIGAKYATILAYQITALRVVGGYFTGKTSQLWADGTAQWFHRIQDATNKPNIAYVTTFMYAYNSFDIDLFGTTIEGYNREFGLFYCGNVNMFGGYTEYLGVPVSETGHRVFVHGVASEFYATGVDRKSVV